MLGKHPLSGLDGAGTMLSHLRKQFHSLLQTTADIMPKVIEHCHDLKINYCNIVFVIV